MEVFAEIVSFFAAFAARKAAFFMPFFSCCRDSCFLMSFIWLIHMVNYAIADYARQVSGGMNFIGIANHSRGTKTYAKQEVRIISIGICRRMSG